MDDIFWGLHNRAAHVCSCSGAIWNSTLGPSPLLEFALPTSSDLQCTCHSLSLLFIPFPVAQRMKLGVLRLWFPHAPCNKRLYKIAFWLTYWSTLRLIWMFLGLEITFTNVEKSKPSTEHHCRRLHQMDGQVYWCRCPAFCHWDISFRDVLLVIGCEQKAAPRSHHECHFSISGVLQHIATQLAFSDFLRQILLSVLELLLGMVNLWQIWEGAHGSLIPSLWAMYRYV